MSRDALLEEIEASQLKADIPHFNVGDTIKVHIRIIEGEKERIQVFSELSLLEKARAFLKLFRCTEWLTALEWSGYFHCIAPELPRSKSFD